MTLPYKGCSALRRIWTTIVFCILSLTTTPTRFFLKLFLCGCSGILLLFLDRIDPRDLAPHQFELVRFFQLARDLFLPQLIQSFFKSLLFLAELVLAQPPQILRFRRLFHGLESLPRNKTRTD